MELLPGVLPSSGNWYEVWFLKLNDPLTKNALWLRYVAMSGPIQGASCWYAIFDKAQGRVMSGRWEESLANLRRPDGSVFDTPSGRLGKNHCTASGNEASWELTWREPTSVPTFRFIPTWMGEMGITRSNYETPVPYALFDGNFITKGKIYRFSGAQGSIGHIWGRKMADGWLWAHAVFPLEDGSVAAMELLSARLRWKSFRTPALTAANLYFKGSWFRSTGIRDLFVNASRLDGNRWKFSVKSGGMRIDGECAQDPGMVADIIYTDTDGSKLRCLNSKTASMSLILRHPDGRVNKLLNPDAAAFEIVSRTE